VRHLPGRPGAGRVEAGRRMTERLYYRDAHLRSFAARITDVSDEGRRVYLDRTAFYPTSGGQPHDVGTLGGVPVVDVVDEGDGVAHVVTGAVAAVGTVAECVIDWTRRFDHMQQHTGQHLLSAVCHEQLDLRTVSVHFGPESATLDLAGGQGPETAEGSTPLSEATIRTLEARANDLVAESRPVTVTFEDAAEAGGLRKPSDRAGTLRIVTIEGVDRSACGGTHVGSTSEIGPVLLRGQGRVRSGIRLEFVCGHRAIARARRDLELLTRIARAHSASLDDAATLVEAQAAQLRDLQSETRRLHEALAGHLAESRYRDAKPGADGLRRVVERRQSGGADASRALALAISGKPKVTFVAVSHDPPSILLATSADSGVDAGRTLRPLLERAGGRGGGSPRLAQGSVPDASRADEIERQLNEPSAGTIPSSGRRGEEARNA